MRCQGEPCKVASGTTEPVSFPSAGSSSDCLNELLSTLFQASPSALSVTLFPGKTPTVHVSILGNPLVDLILKECDPIVAREE